MSHARNMTTPIEVSANDCAGEPCPGRTGARSLRGSFALVIFVVLAAPATALAHSRADVVPTEDQVSVRQTSLSQAQPDSPEIPSQIRFGWPAAGRIIAGFCWEPEHDHRDGINIAALPGTEVRAIEAGRIAYAGDELRGLHNLILIFHRDGWVSAYANAGERLVKRGDSVERGQVIARIGDDARLHLELRHHAVPVDPMLYLVDAAPNIAQTAQHQCPG